MLPDKKALILAEVAEGTGAAICLEAEPSGVQAGLCLWFGDLKRTHSPIVTLRPLGLRRFEARLTFGMFAADTIRQMQKADLEEIQLARALVASVTRYAEMQISGDQPLGAWSITDGSFSITAQKKDIEARFGDEALVAVCRELVTPLLAAMAELYGYDPVVDSLQTGHEVHLEGAMSLHLVRKRERNPRNRLLCLRLHGEACTICGIKPSSVYGGAGAIMEVHHLQPLSLATEPRLYDPATALVPLCPNCHAAVHTRRPLPWSPSEIRQLMPGAAGK
jgi:5-methylcytosine-specific restriction protein A